MRLVNLPADDSATKVFESLRPIAEARQIEMRLML
jgi:hypothetical protein